MATEFYFEDLYLRDGAGNRYCGPLEGWCRCDAGSVTGIDLPAWAALDTSFAKAERKTLAADEWLAIQIAAALKQTNVYAAKIIDDLNGGDDGEFDEDRYVKSKPERHHQQRELI